MSRRDTSRDGLKNKLETFALTHFRFAWRLAQKFRPLRCWLNKRLINSAILKVPTRPYPFSNWGPFTCWESLTDKRWSSRHLPPDYEFNREDKLPPLDLTKMPPDPSQDANPLTVLFRKRKGKTIESAKSTLLFPYWVQWFTDSFLRTDPDQRLKNTSNHHIDLCNVYGLTRKSTSMLRSGRGGRLKSQVINGEEYPPYFYEETRDNPAEDVIKEEFRGLYEPLRSEKRLPKELRAKMFAMGVERANVQIGYLMLNVLWFREHNRLCGLLADAYAEDWRKEFETLPKDTPMDDWRVMHRDWTEPSESWKESHPEWRYDREKYVDERVFQTARNILTLLIMKIVVEEYINHITPYHFNFIVDPPAFADARWYRENWMPQEFSLVYRWHRALPSEIRYDDKQAPVVDTMWRTDMVTSKGLGALFEEASSQPASRIGFFNTPESLIPVELLSIGLGRESQMPSYNDYRELAGFPRVTAFDQITGDTEIQQKLREIYKEVDHIEFYVGLFAEDVRPNSALPALIGRMVGIDAFSQAFTNPLLAEHVFNERTFTPIGWKVIHETDSLSDLVHRNVPPSDRRYNVTFYR